MCSPGKVFGEGVDAGGTHTNRSSASSLVRPCRFASAGAGGDRARGIETLKKKQKNEKCGLGMK
jgi:hypothetical protein